MTLAGGTGLRRGRAGRIQFRIEREITVTVRDRTALRKRIEKLSMTKLNDSRDLASALLIVNESLQDLAERVISLERLVAKQRRLPK